MNPTPVPPLTVLVAPAGFKEGLGAREVAEHIAGGVLKAMPQARVLQAPLVDGGEGFVAALIEATGGRLQPCRVTGPVGAPVDAVFGWLGGAGPLTAVIEVAEAAGLRRVPRGQRDPRLTTSHGVGELIRAALDGGARRILLGCGDSGVNDGGAGMLQALGVRLLDAQGRSLARGGAALLHLHRIELLGLDPRLATVTLEAAVNWHNRLLGADGVSRVYGPQKGATPEQALELDAALGVYADRIRWTTGRDVAALPGAGASGGIGAGFTALLGGALQPRYDMVMPHLDFDRRLALADLVITAEGQLDAQTLAGKLPAEVARRARALGRPVIALAGSVAPELREQPHGFDAFCSIVEQPCSLEAAMADAPRLLAQAAEHALRLVAVGARLARGTPQVQPAPRLACVGG